LKQPQIDSTEGLSVIVAVFIRRLRKGMTFEDFKRAWEADKGFGVPTRVFSAVALDEPRLVLTIGFVAVNEEMLAAGIEAARPQEQVRHDRIDDVIESTELRAMYELRSEHDFTAAPREIEVGAAESLLAALAR
jgi:hypothetical protein